MCNTLCKLRNRRSSVLQYRVHSLRMESNEVSIVLGVALLIQ